MLNTAAQMPFCCCLFDRIQIHTNVQVRAGALVCPRHSRDHPDDWRGAVIACQKCHSSYFQLTSEIQLSVCSCPFFARVRLCTHQHVTGPEGDSFTFASPFWLISKEQGSVKDDLQVAAVQQSGPEDQGSSALLL